MVETISASNAQLSGGERLDALLTLVGQHRERFSQVEGIEWKVNFSNWAFIGGIAFLFTNDGKAVTPPNQYWHYWLFGFATGLVALHFFSLLKLNRSAFQHRCHADFYRNEAKKVLGLPMEELATPTWKAPLPKEYRWWLVLECGTTILLMSVVLLLLW